MRLFSLDFEDITTTTKNGLNSSSLLIIGECLHSSHCYNLEGWLLNVDYYINSIYRMWLDIKINGFKLVQ